MALNLFVLQREGVHPTGKVGDTALGSLHRLAIFLQEFGELHPGINMDVAKSLPQPPQRGLLDPVIEDQARHAQGLRGDRGTE
jgi:hypothetical protein